MITQYLSHYTTPQLIVLGTLVFLVVLGGLVLLSRFLTKMYDPTYSIALETVEKLLAEELEARHSKNTNDADFYTINYHFVTLGRDEYEELIRRIEVVEKKIAQMEVPPDSVAIG